MKAYILFLLGILPGLSCGSSNKDCQPTDSERSTLCKNNVEYWVDDCGNQGEQKAQCECGCASDVSCKTECGCEPTNAKDSVICRDDAEWWVDDCGNQGEQKAQCECGCSDELSCETACCRCDLQEQCDVGCECDPDCMKTIVCPDPVPVDDALNPGMDLYAVAAIDDNNVWVVGNAETMVHFDGVLWSLVDGPYADFSYSLRSVACGVRTCWAVGQFDTAFGAYATYLSFDGQTWSVGQSSLAWGLRDVALVDDDNGWTVGSKYTFSEINNGTFSPGVARISPFYTMYSVALADSNHGWAVGSRGQVWRLDYTWSDYGSEPTDYSLYAIALEDEQNGWAVGKGGVMLRLASGTCVELHAQWHGSLC